MKTLIVLATKSEAIGIFPNLESSFKEEGKTYSVNDNRLEFDVLITGIGGYFTIYHLTKQLLQAQYNIVINAGIAGSFSKFVNIGSVVEVTSDTFVDLGFETKKGVKSIFSSEFYSPENQSFIDGVINNEPSPYTSTLKKAKALTSSIAHGKQDSIKFIEKNYDPDIETMEGAAVFYVCKQLSVPCLQLRSISNYVETRDRSTWDIPFALQTLSAEIKKVLTEIYKDQ